MKVSIYMAFSANGFISSYRGVPDWLSQEYGKGLYEICQRTKAVIMGRKTYDILTSENLPLKDAGTTIVLSSNSSKESPNSTVVFTDKSPEEIVGLLERKKHKEAVIIGGTVTVTEFIKAGLVDNIYFVIEPVLFGSGLPLLKNSEMELKLELESIEQINRNSIKVHYSIIK